MSPYPQELIDRWHNRSEDSPGEGTVYWHILLGENQELRSIVAKAHDRLSKFSGLHLVPLRWLHITTHIAGRANQIDDNDLPQMVEAARTALTGTAPIQVTFQSVFYHPEAIVLGARPQEALTPIRQAALAATQAVTGKDNTASERTQQWMPHVTLCYSTGRQPTAPIIAALGTDLPACQVSIQSLSLVVQRGPERLWDWHHIGTAHLRSPDPH
jgi:2'-5' RNA ligase